MSEHVKMSESPAPGIYDATPEPSSSRRLAHPNTAMQLMSLSPAGYTSSDKENHKARTVNGGKGKERAVMAPPRRSEPESRSRKRTAPDRVESEERHQRQRTIEVDEESEEEDSAENYDPDQNIEERRELRRNLRDASKNLMDNRSEFLKPTSTGLIDALKIADKLSENVKQTADATIDSRMLVNAADLSYKKTLALTTGDSATGVDVDEFVSKCITYMKKAVGGSGVSTQAPSNTQRRRRANAGNDSDGEGDEGDMLNWEHLGRFACLPNNSRPPVSGFLLGPLSVEKRARKVAARRAALRPDRLQETRPEVLEAKDIGKSGDGNLTTLTMNIHGRLRKVIKEATAAVQDEYEEGMSEKEQMALCDRHSLSIDGGIALFKFVVNPHSFGQTVENLFYVSFLIRDGKVGIDVDGNGMPFLTKDVKAQRNGYEPTDQGAQKYQAVLAIDMDSWQSLIELFDITESMIPHREEVVQGELAARGWYA